MISDSSYVLFWILVFVTFLELCVKNGIHDKNRRKNMNLFLSVSYIVIAINFLVLAWRN